MSVVVYKKDNTHFLTVEPNDSSTRVREIMGNNIVTLNFSLPSYYNFPVDCYIVFNGTRYTMYRKAKVKKIHNRNFEYTLELYSPDYITHVRKFRNVVINYSAYTISGDHRLSFPLTATPKEHLQMVVDCLNKEAVETYGSQATGLWTVGDCIDWDGTTDSGTKTLVSYDDCYCIEALALQANTFKTEYYFDNVNKRISLGKLEYEKNNPLIMSYGEDKGFVSGVGYSNAEQLPPTERLFVIGGERNINPATYGIYKHSYEVVDNITVESVLKISDVPSKTLLLPYKGELYYDGTTVYTDLSSVPTTVGSTPKDLRHYIVSADRLSIVRAGNMYYDRQNSQWTEIEVNAHYDSVNQVWVEANGLTEESYVCSDEVYPKYVGIVDRVVSASAQNNFVDIYDDLLFGFVGSADNADVISHLGIEGESVTIVFQSGSLSGREFDLGGRTDGTIVCDYDPTYGFKIEIVPAEIDGIVMPGGNPKYTVLTQEPSDWSTNYGNYYYYVSGNVYKPLTTAARFVSGVYYSCELDNTFMPSVGDKFVVFGIDMPWTYYDDNNFGGAEWDMFKESVKYLYEHENESYTFSGDIDTLWLQRYWTGYHVQIDGSIINGVGNYMNLGYYIKFMDDIMIDGILLRVTAVKENINNPKNVYITLSNALVETKFKTNILRMRGNEPLARVQRNRDRVETDNRSRETRRTIIQKVNSVSERVNEDRELFFAINAAIESFNEDVERLQQGMPSVFEDFPIINFTNCIDNTSGSVVPYSEKTPTTVCKIIPNVQDITKI